MKILRILFCCLVLAISSFGQVDKVEIKDLGWLAGNWEYKLSDGTVVSEFWTKPSGIMLGLGHTTKDSKVRTYEYLRIITKDSTIFYVAKPSKADSETMFKLTKSGKDSVTFENAGHDFPKKIKYSKMPNGSVFVEVLGDGNQGFSYEMTIAK